MRYVFILFLLCGCTTQTPTQTVINTAAAEIKELKKSLPEACKTDDMYNRIDKIETLIQTAPKTCEAQVREVKAQRNSYALGCFVLLLLVALSFVRRSSR